MELASVLLQFQPDSPELKQKRDYDIAARNFVSQLANFPASHWLKGIDTPQDVFTVRIPRHILDSANRTRYSTLPSTQ